MNYRLALAAILLLMISAPAWSEGLAGLWQEYDDETGKVEALIRIEKADDDSYEGRIEKLIPDVAANAARACSRCQGDLRNKPLLGLRILFGMKRTDKLDFDGGQVVDPDDGKVYQCHIRLAEDGKSIEVTGYIGAKWLGQSETWRRAE